MNNFQVKIGQVKEPSGLAFVQFLGLTEICQVLVVGKHLYWERRTKEIVSSRFQGSDNSQEFPIVNVIVLFCSNEQLEEVGAGVPFTVGANLEEDSPRSIF